MPSRAFVQFKEDFKGGGGGGDATVEKNDAPKAIDWHFPPRGNFGQGFLDGGLNLTLRPPQ